MSTDAGGTLVCAEVPGASRDPETPVALARSREEFLARASVGVICKEVRREAVARLLAAHNVNATGVEMVNRVVYGGQKVREPRSTMFSSLVAHVSPKMREVVTCESATVEYQFALQQDHDPHVLGYFSQPCELELCYQGRSRVQRVLSAPDFLVLTPSFVGFYESKSRQWLEREARRCSKRWCWDEERGWHSPPGEEAAARLGLGYRVWTPELSSAVFLENAEFLLDFLRVDAPAVSEGTRELVRSVVSDVSGADSARGARSDRQLRRALHADCASRGLRGPGAFSAVRTARRAFVQRPRRGAHMVAGARHGVRCSCGRSGVGAALGVGERAAANDAAQRRRDGARALRAVAPGD